MTGQLSWGQWALEGVVLECGLWTREWGHHSSPRGDTCKHPQQGHPQHPQVSKEAVGEAVGAETGVWLVGKPKVLTQFMKTPATE